MNDVSVIPHISVFPNRICFWNEYNGLNYKERYKFSECPECVDCTSSNCSDCPFAQRRIDWGLKLKGNISIHAAKRIKKYVNWLLFLAKKKQIYIPELDKKINFHISFITLSLPSKQIHSDKEIKEKCLNQFLIELRTKWKCRLYLWKAEAQVNGNIHFHITLDKFIFYGDLRNTWNRIINKLGYVDRYVEQMSKLSEADYIKSYKSSTSIKTLKKRYAFGINSSWTSPNSTDVHSVRKIYDLSSYLAKYFCKNEEDEGRRKIDGNLWYCSELLSKFNSLVLQNTCSTEEETCFLWNKLEKLQFSKDFIMLLKVPIYQIPKYIKNSKIYECFLQYVEKILSENQLCLADLQ